MPITSGIIITPASLRSELITFSPESVIIISGIRTLLLGEQTEISGTSYILQLSDEYRQLLVVPEGGSPTQEQIDTYSKAREYIVPALNRGQHVVATYLTTVGPGIQGPSVWLDILHQGVRAQFRQNTPQIHGVPVRSALAVGLVTCLITLGLCSIYISAAWAAAAIGMGFGLLAQTVGAAIYRFGRWLRTVVVG